MRFSYLVACIGKHFRADDCFHLGKHIGYCFFVVHVQDFYFFFQRPSLLMLRVNSQATGLLNPRPRIMP